MKIYMVGGAVRDKLLGLPVTDRDWVVTGATPQQMLNLGYRPVGRDFPVFLHPETQEEYALARTERKTGPGYTGFTFNTSPEITVEQDLQRRDLTINAMAEDEHGRLIDPFNGKRDLDAGILRHVSPAFLEDPLRVVRLARFAARFNFSIADETMQYLKQIADSGELDALVAERVWQETEKALSLENPSRFFTVLRETGALKIIFPELDRLFGVPQPPDYHPEIDTGLHTMMVLTQVTEMTDDTSVRFAALVHDLGKGTTPADELPAHRGHEERGVDIIAGLCDRYRIPNKYRELAIIVSRYHLDCHRVAEMRPETIIEKLESLDAFRRPDRFEQFLIACEADARGRAGLEDRDYNQRRLFNEYLNAATNINMGPLRDNGLQGKDIARAIRLARIAAVREIASGSR